MSIPEPKFIPEEQVPKNKQARIWLELLEKTPMGQSAVLTFSTREEAQKRQGNIMSILAQKRKQGLYISFKVTRNDATLYITNHAEETPP